VGSNPILSAIFQHHRGLFTPGPTQSLCKLRTRIYYLAICAAAQDGRDLLAPMGIIATAALAFGLELAPSSEGQVVGCGQSRKFRHRDREDAPAYECVFALLSPANEGLWSPPQSRRGLQIVRNEVRVSRVRTHESA
jgi:hypothetical protein